ncbi:PqqD family protein [Hydrogenophaga taeniospiralis]|uniref:PqqD family protein n=1 Tax=Hydrogenophaga taeniospiralis TaxID=65656 RepID=UPI001CF98088|nr:PqqD family protein [Hydrogenophaga taeniospiralis]UCU92219.1 PqqD family protein [Hydrogenophaga taeniospiralis]
MDTVSGRLFLLEQAAATLWESITKSETREAIISTINLRYGPAEQAAAEACLKRLIELGLVTERVFNDEIVGMESTGQHWPAVLGEFLVTQYEDMTSIITMDPIHDIDPQRGWPFEGRN